MRFGPTITENTQSMGLLCFFPTWIPPSEWSWECIYLPSRVWPLSLRFASAFIHLQSAFNARQSGSLLHVFITFYGSACHGICCRPLPFLLLHDFFYIFYTLFVCFFFFFTICCRWLSCFCYGFYGDVLLLLVWFVLRWVGPFMAWKFACCVGM